MLTHPVKINNNTIIDAIAALKNGGLIIYPTETFYGLGADAMNHSAVERILGVKARGTAKTLPIIVSDISMLLRICKQITESASVLIKKFWPGPLTIIFQAKKDLPTGIVSESGKVAVRISSSGIAQKIVKGLGSPVVATSANLSGGKSPVAINEIHIGVRSKAAIIIDSGRLSGVKGSTIVDATVNPIMIIRDGEIPSEQILNSLKE